MPADLQHQLFYMTLDGKLLMAPISDHPQHVLDVGTGTGIWAIDFGKGDTMPHPNTLLRTMNSRCISLSKGEPYPYLYNTQLPARAEAPVPA
jgi:hypothetical protein